MPCQSKPLPKLKRKKQQGSCSKQLQQEDEAGGGAGLGSLVAAEKEKAHALNAIAGALASANELQERQLRLEEERNKLLGERNAIESERNDVYKSFLEYIITKGFP